VTCVCYLTGSESKATDCCDVGVSIDIAATPIGNTKFT
jgi:hypothetical protein